MTKRWTPDDDATLRRLYPTAAWPTMLEALGRPYGGIVHRAGVLGLKREVRGPWPEQWRAEAREYRHRRREADPDYAELLIQYQRDARAKRKWEREQQGRQ
jgi:hypothetical protein